MFPALSLAVPPHLLLRLLQQLGQSGDERDLGELCVQLLEQWLAAAEPAAQQPAAPEPEAPAPKAQTAAEPRGGYCWKEVFLPNGTVLRGVNDATAVVRNGQLLWNGRPVTPNRLCGGAHDSSHNAWKAIRIQRPGESGYTQAWRLRREARGLPQVPRPWFPQRELAAPLREPIPQPPEAGKVPLCDRAPLHSTRAPTPAAADRAGAPQAQRRPQDRWCVPFDGGHAPGACPPHDPGEPVMIISRERRKLHARRITDSVWDE